MFGDLFIQRRRARGGAAPAFGAGLLLGVGLAFLLDPVRGAARRARLAQGAGAAARRTRREARKRARDLAQRAEGRRYEAEHADELVPDDVLVERVRAQLGKRTRHAGSIGVHAQDGMVILTGPILRHELDGVVDVVRHVRGVRGIESRLDLHDQRENVPGLQG